MTISGTIERAPGDGYYFTDCKSGDILFRSFGSNSFSFGSGSNILSAFRVNSNMVSVGAPLFAFGTSNPQAQLHLYNGTQSPSMLIDGGGISGRGTLRFTTTNAGNYIQSGAQFSNDSKQDLIFSSMNGITEWMRIKGSTGNVGIGLNNPQYSLHVSGTGYLGTCLSPTISTSNIVSSSTNINIGCDSVTQEVNIGCGSNAQVVNIGTSSAGTTINIGGTGDTVNILGTTNYIQSTDLQIMDKVITLNKGGAAFSGIGAGIEIEESNIAIGYIKTSTDRNSFLFRAPSGTRDLVMNLSSGAMNLNNGGFVMSSACNIGIGTSSPSAKLEVVGEIKHKGLFWCFTGSDCNFGVQIFSNNQDGASSNQYQGGIQSWWGVGLRCKTDNTTRHMFDTRTGNTWLLGSQSIGTDIITNSKLYIEGVGRHTNIESLQHQLQLAEGSTRLFMGADSNSEIGYIQAGKSLIGKRTISLNPQGGNVGIGTSVAAQKLDIAGTTIIRRGNTTGSSFDQLLFSYNATDNFKHSIKTRHSASDGVDNAIDFYVWQSAQVQTDIGNRLMLSVTNAGVGVGKSNPNYTLDVNGIVNASNLYVNGVALGSIPSFWTQANYGNYSGCNVGLGTSNFAARLHIIGGGSTFSNNLVQCESASSTDASYITFTNTSSTHRIGTDGIGWVDTNRGALNIFSMCNNPIVFGTNNSQKMILSSSGSIGIGTSSPNEFQGALLNVYNSNTTALQALLTNNGTGRAGIALSNRAGISLITHDINNNLAIYGSDSQSFISSSGWYFQDQQNANITRVFIGATGNVGIGTTVPSQLLDVIGTSSTAILKVGTSNQDYGRVILGSINHGIARGANISTASNVNDVIVHTSGTGSVVFATNGPTEYMRVNPSGNVGIGSASPVYKLDVAGPVQFGQTTNNKVGISDYEIKMFGIGSRHYSLFNSNNMFTIRDTSSSTPFGTIGTTIFTISNNLVGIGKTPGTGFQLDLSADGARKLTTTTWSTGSDERVKNNIQLANLDICYSNIKNIPLKYFEWDSNVFPTLKDRNAIGFIAQDVKKHIPKAVEISPDYGFDDFHTLDIDQIIKNLYGCVQKLQGIVETQSDEIRALKSLMKS
jgi:Phage T4 tail fibre/Chaperone of endosialidase